MARRKLGIQFIFAAKEEGLPWEVMDIFPIETDIDELKQDGYIIFYYATVDYAIDAHIH